MKIYEFTDFVQRKINSILFRIVIVTFSGLLLYIYPNIFDLKIYVLFLLIYFILYFLLLKHEKLRLLNDFILINFIILGKNPNEALIFTYLILPIINSINFSGSKKTPMLYIYTATTFILQLCYFNNKIERNHIFDNIYQLSSILFLWLINSYTTLRIKIKNFREELNSVVDTFYLKKEEIKHPHKIYKLLIDAIQKNTNDVSIEDIICFTIAKEPKEKLLIVNGSRFTWQAKFLEQNIIADLREKRSLINTKFLLEEVEKPFNLVVYTKAQEQEYIYVFIVKKTIPLYYVVIGFFRTLEPTLKKISSVLLSEKNLRDVKNEEIAKLSLKRQYVNRANKTMHFIRNRLGPFSNLVKMLENFEAISEDKVDILKALITKETERARIELSNISERANSMLEKSTNPFVYTKLEPISLERLFTILKRNTFNFFPDTDIIQNVTPNSNKRYVLINEEGYELFLSDWLNNMSKYKKDFVEFLFILDDENLHISFLNNYSQPLSDIQQMISDLTSDNRNEIMQRTTHGLYTIKSTLEDMDIRFEVTLENEDNVLVLKLTLKTRENGNSNL